MDLLKVIESLRVKRPIFHSEADFQFALAWEIQLFFPSVHIRLEYPPKNEPNKYIDIIVRDGENVYPIELKYPTKKYSIFSHGEQFNLKDHGAQDLGKYDFIKDICRVESFSLHMEGFVHGYVLWLTNDPSYWTPPKRENVGYAAFSVHHGVKKAGSMAWGPNLGIGTIKGREAELLLKNEYDVQWINYSDLGGKSGLFKFSLLKISN